MLNGTGTTSLRKQDLTDQKNIATGFIKTQFAHQCAGGETGVNLNALTLPSQMSSNGFTNPSGAQLAAASLLNYRKNLKLVSSLRGQLVDFLSYTVASGTQINFVGFTALPGEIFVGTLDYSAVNGVQVVSATGQPATGTLTAGTQTFSIGFAIPTNQYSTTQLGGVLVYLDGVLQTRNTGNSSTTLDGNYYEVDNGSGNFSTISFNVADPVNTRNVLVVPNGLLVNNADGVLSTVVQTQQGQINQLSAYVAALAGTTTSTVLGGAPSYTDLLAFGNTVNTIKNNYANLTVSNTFTAVQLLPGATDGTTVASGYVGQVLTATAPSGTLSNGSYVQVASIALPAGRWLVLGCITIGANSASTWTDVQAVTALTSAADDSSYRVADTSTQVISRALTITPRYVTTSTGQTVYINVTSTHSGNNPQVTTGNLFAIRIG